MKQLFIFFFLILTFSACQETQVPEPEPPEELIPPSEVGAGFVSCLVNGEVWNVTSRANIESSLTTGVFLFSAGKTSFQRQEGIGFDVDIRVNADQDNLGVYPLLSFRTGASAGFSIITIENERQVLQRYRTNTEYTGELIITRLDSEENIISGTFWYDAERESTGEIVQIRNGRFDIKF